MQSDQSVKCLLLLIVLLLGVIAVHPYMAPPAVSAQSAEPSPFFVEPGVTMLRAPDGRGQVLGKVVIDMRNGNVWGFPTGNKVFGSHSTTGVPISTRPTNQVVRNKMISMLTFIRARL